MIPGRTLGEQIQNHLGQPRSESHTPNGGSRSHKDIDIDRALEPGDGQLTRREFLGAAAAATTAVAGCGNNTDETTTERKAADTPLQDTAEPVDEATEAEVVETPEERSEPQDFLEDMDAYERVVMEMWDGEDIDENVRQDVQRKFSEGNQIEALGEGMQHGAATGGFSDPAFYDNMRQYKSSGAGQAAARAIELCREKDPDNRQEALGLHRINVDIKRVLLDGQEADIAVVEDTQENETYLATNINLAPGEEGPNAAVYRIGTEPEGTTQELLKGLTNPEDIGSGTVFDWETRKEARESLTDYDPETNARQMSRYFGDIVAGPSLTYGDWIGGSEEVQYPMLFTDKFHKELSEGSSLGLVDRTREITNKVAETDRASSEIYVVGEGGKVIATDYDLSKGAPKRLAAV